MIRAGKEAISKVDKATLDISYYGNSKSRASSGMQEYKSTCITGIQVTVYNKK